MEPLLAALRSGEITEAQWLSFVQEGTQCVKMKQLQTALSDFPNYQALLQTVSTEKATTSTTPTTTRAWEYISEDDREDASEDDGSNGGVSIQAFGHTNDKIVITPAHFGFAFNYFWGQGTWGRAHCWNSESSKKTRKDAYRQMMDLSTWLRDLGYRTEFFIVSGRSKGYLSPACGPIYDPFTLHWADLEKAYINHDIVLFVYGLTIPSLQSVFR